MLLDRQYPFESNNITVESFPLILAFSRGEKELTTPVNTVEIVTCGREEGTLCRARRQIATWLKAWK